MKAAAVFIVVAVAVLWILSTPRLGYDPVEYARRDAEAQRIAQAAQLDAEWAPARAAAMNLALISFLALGVLGAALGGGAALARFRSERRPDERGLLPVVRSDLPHVATAALGDFHGTERTRAGIAPVPASYAPHFAYHNKSDSSGVAGDVVEQPLALPGLTDLATISHTPTPQSILLALGPGGVPVTVPAKALCHVALCGATGQGKSNLMRLLLPQLQAMGARVVLADPHYTDFDAESGDDWRPIRKRLAVAPAIHPKDINDLFTYLVRELEERKARRERGGPTGKALFLALDELPVIIEDVKDAPARLGKLLREGRKFGLYVVGASQDFLVKTIGGTGAVRDCYRTAFYVGGDLVSARALLDMPQREIDEGALQTGIAYLRSASTSPAQLVRVPLASNAAVARMLEVGGSRAEVATEAPTSRRPDAANADNAKSALVRALIARKATQNEIIQEVWRVSGGRGYQTASNELRDIMADLVRSA